MEEILHQLIGSLFHYLQGFIHPRWLFGISSISIMSFLGELFTDPKNEAEVRFISSFVTFDSTRTFWKTKLYKSSGTATRVRGDRSKLSLGIIVVDVYLLIT